MMHHVYSPRWNNEWHLTAAQWAAQRAAVRAVVYPSGLLTSGVSSVVRSYDGITLPPQCSRVDQYTITDPGGNICAEPQHQYLCRPTLQTHDTLLVFQCGHVSPIDAGGYYISNDGTSVPIEWLRGGGAALVVPMPSFDWAGNPIWQHITIGGAVTAVYEHDYQLLDAVGERGSARMFQDQIIRATTQAIADLSPERVVLIGHSGGAVSSAVTAAVDDRFDTFVSLNSGMKYELATDEYSHGGPSDSEGYAGAPVFLAGSPQIVDHWNMLAIGGAHPGRRMAWSNSENDEYWPVEDEPLWRSLSDDLRDFVSSASGHRPEVRLDPAQHAITTERCQWAINFALA